MTVLFVARTHIRDAPTRDGKSLGVVPVGERGTLLNYIPTRADAHEWWHIQTGNITGWCARKVGEQHLFRIEPEAFETAVTFTLSREGGYVVDTTGGETNFGISKRSHPNVDIKNLTIEMAKEIYYEEYWLGSQAWRYPYPKSLCLFDIGVVSGTYRALLFRQVEPLQMLIDQSEFYTTLSAFNLYGRGWIRRNNALMRLVMT